MSEENIKELTLDELDESAGGKLDMSTHRITMNCPKCGMKTVHKPLSGLWQCSVCEFKHKKV